MVENWVNQSLQASPDSHKFTQQLRLLAGCPGLIVQRGLAFTCKTNAVGVYSHQGLFAILEKRCLFPMPDALVFVMAMQRIQCSSVKETMTPRNIQERIPVRRIQE